MAIQRSTATEALVREIERRIQTGDLQAEERLPGEATMAKDYGVSRPIIREALGYLRERGYVYTINGSGTFVRHPDSEAVSTVIERHLLFSSNHNISVKNLYEARTAIEVTSARLAAVRATPEDISALDAFLAEMTDGQDDRARYAAADMGFHIRIAHASGNPLLPGLLAPLARTIISGMVETHATPTGVAVGLAMHAKILECVASGDELGAAEAMAEHLQDSESIFPETLLGRSTTARDTESD
jgi:GntR family transcriptional repressor for pyruvate dehydrogenase complex